MEQVLTLREAATHLGCSKETVRRAVVAGELEAMSGWGQRGRELRVSSEGLLAWWQRHTGTASAAVVVPPEEVEALASTSAAALEVVEGPTVSRPEVVESDEVVVEDQPVAREVLEVVEDEAVGVHEALESTRPEANEAVGAVPYSVHTHALEVALRAMERAQELEKRWNEEREQRERAERQATALASELGQYRRALTESAESLAEERSRAQAAELLCATLKGADAEAAQRGWGARLRGWLFGTKAS